MPTDQRPLVTQYTDDEMLSPYHRNYWPEGFVYLISWPEDGIVKVGETQTPRRWRRYLATGARIVLIARTDVLTGLAIEREMCRRLADAGGFAFETKEQSLPYLNGTGGHLECFIGDALTALDQMQEVIDALVQG